MPAAIVVLLLLLVTDLPIPLATATSDSSDKSKTGSNQGLTLNEIGRGLKSAAKNIEEEIPKIGPAIGKTFKQVTGSGKDAGASKETAPTSPRPKK